MTHQYSDLFTYETLAFDGANVSYSNVTLLKDICAKKAGVSVDEIRLNTRTGKFTVPRSKATARSTTAIETAARTLVEFKGTHTRFEDSTTVEDAEPDTCVCAPEDSTVVEDAEPDTGVCEQNAVVTLKIYENKRKLYKPDSAINKYVLASVTKAVSGKLVENSTGSRGELLVTLMTSDEIPEKTLFEFTVCTTRSGRGTRKMYYSRVV